MVTPNATSFWFFSKKAGLLVFALCLGAQSLAFQALASCPLTDSKIAKDICLLDGKGSQDGTQAICPTAPAVVGNQTSVIGAGYRGAKIAPGVQAQTPIDKFGLCRFVDNIGGADYIIPFRTSAEWRNFIVNHPAATLSVNSCACPFSGQDGQAGLYYGQTSASAALGDRGDATTAAVTLPYWRTGAVYSAPLHTFSNSCYSERPEPQCLHIGVCYDSCCDAKGGNCTQCNPHECCDQTGSTCAQEWHDWHESFNFTANAGDGDAASPSWVGHSSRVGGTLRPGICNQRCTFDGVTCGNCTPPTQTPLVLQNTCDVPKVRLLDAHTLHYCMTNQQTSEACKSWATQVMLFEAYVSGFLSQNNSCSAANERIMENNFVESINTHTTRAGF